MHSNASGSSYSDTLTLLACIDHCSVHGSRALQSQEGSRKQGCLVYSAACACWPTNPSASLCCCNAGVQACSLCWCTAHHWACCMGWATSSGGQGGLGMLGSQQQHVHIQQGLVPSQCCNLRCALCIWPVLRRCPSSAVGRLCMCSGRWSVLCQHQDGCKHGS
jgi:hypothetical protein